MSRNSKVIEESGCKVPGYIVTFSDMVTLLLTFFVMLLSLADEQDPELFNATKDAFVKHIDYIGLGMLWDEKMRPNLGKPKIRYFIREPDKDLPVRTIDAKEENARRVFNKVARSMETMPSQIVAKKTNFSVTNIGFSPGEARLNEPVKKFLTQYAMDLQQDIGSEEVKLYILGLARDERTEKKQWILSARRAQVVADFLENILPSQFQCPVYSWGAGPGGYWITQDSPISKQSQILIAVLRAKD
ncbi:MAG: OmpA family protein [Planctomycetes bacterium]|nr:OmpA family protein [Planctomycetota bacterium]